VSLASTDHVLPHGYRTISRDRYTPERPFSAAPQGRVFHAKSSPSQPVILITHPSALSTHHLALQLPASLLTTKVSQSEKTKGPAGWKGGDKAPAGRRISRGIPFLIYSG
jgi:hypothetical protein